MKGRTGALGSDATYYLLAGRTPAAALQAEIARAAQSPLVTALLDATGSAAAVIDAHRQIVAVNGAYLRVIGVDDPHATLGMRPGETLKCVHAAEGPDGCGTGPACASCGQAAAILIASRHGGPAERTCYLARRWDGREQHCEFRVRARAIDVEGEHMVLVAFTDDTQASQRAALARVLLHDLGNLAVSLQAAAGVLGEEGGESAEMRDVVKLLSDQLAREVRLQRAMAGSEREPYQPSRRPVDVAAALALLRGAVSSHPSMSGRRLEFDPVPVGCTVETDPTPLQHVLVNMVLNALEASPRGGVVRVAVAARRDAVAFRVWNAGAIPAAVVPRIFQRHFTTKAGDGRGHGTHAMKLFGEHLLGGRVGFTTSSTEGTWFEIALPTRAPAG